MAMAMAAAPGPLWAEQAVPPSPNSGRACADWLRNYAGASWFAYAAGSNVVVSNSPSLSGHGHSRASRFFTQLLRAKVEDGVRSTKATEGDEGWDDADRDDLVTCVAWGGKRSSMSGVLAAVSASVVHVFAPRSLRVDEESTLPEIPFQWEKCHQLIHSYAIHAISWTESGDGLLCAGDKIIMWQCQMAEHGVRPPSEIQFSPLWQTRSEFSQTIAAASFSFNDFCASAGSDYRIKRDSIGDLLDSSGHEKNQTSDLGNGYGNRLQGTKPKKQMATVWVWAHEGVMSIDLPHPQKVVGLQWRPCNAPFNSSRFHRQLLLTSCEDGVVRLWMEVNGGTGRLKKRRVEKNLNDAPSFLPPSFFVCAVVEAERTLGQRLSVNLWVHWSEEVWVGGNSSSKTENKIASTRMSQENDVAPCEWIIGVNSSGSVALWCLHCLDDISPPRCPRVMMWQQSCNLLPPHSCDENRTAFERLENSESVSTTNSICKSVSNITPLSFLIHSTVERLEGTKSGPPTSAEIFQMLPHGLFRCSRLWLPLSAIGEGKSGATSKSSSSRILKDSGMRSNSNLNSNSHQNAYKKNSWGASTSTISLEHHDHPIQQISIHPCVSLNLAGTLDCFGNILLWKSQSSFLPRLSQPIQSSPFMSSCWKLFMKIPSSFPSKPKNLQNSDDLNQLKDKKLFPSASTLGEVNHTTSAVASSVSLTSLVEQEVNTHPTAVDAKATEIDKIPDSLSNLEKFIEDEKCVRKPLVGPIFDKISWAPFLLPGGSALLFRADNLCIQVFLVKNLNSVNPHTSTFISNEDSYTSNSNLELLCELEGQTGKDKLKFNGVYTTSVPKVGKGNDSHVLWGFRDGFDFSLDEKYSSNSKKSESYSDQDEKRIEKILVVGIVGDGEAILSWILEIDSQTLPVCEFRFSPSIKVEETALNDVSKEQIVHTKKGWENWFLNCELEGDIDEKEGLTEMDKNDVKVESSFLEFKEFQKGQRLTCASALDSGRLPPAIFQEGFENIISELSGAENDCFINFVTGDEEGNVMIWNIDTFGKFQVLGFIDAHDYPIQNLSVTLGGNRIATSCFASINDAPFEISHELDDGENSRMISCVRIWEIDTAVLTHHEKSDLGYTIESELLFKNRVVDLDWLDPCNGDLLLGITTHTHFHVFCQSNAHTSGPVDIKSEVGMKSSELLSNDGKLDFNLSSHFEKYALENSSTNLNSKADKSSDLESSMPSPQSHRFQIKGFNLGGWMELAVRASSDDKLVCGKWDSNGTPIIASGNQLLILSNWIYKSSLGVSNIPRQQTIPQRRGLNPASDLLSSPSSYSVNLCDSGLEDDPITLIDLASKFNRPPPNFHRQMILRYLMLGRIGETRACLRHLALHFKSKKGDLSSENPLKSEIWFAWKANGIPHIPLYLLFDASTSPSDPKLQTPNLPFDQTGAKTYNSSNPFSLIQAPKIENKYSFLKNYNNEGEKRDSSCFDTNDESDESTYPLKGGKTFLSKKESKFIAEVITLSNSPNFSNEDRTQLLSAVDLVAELDEESAQNRNLSLDLIAQRFYLSARFEMLLCARKNGSKARLEAIHMSSKQLAFMIHSQSSDSLLSHLLPNPPTWEAMRSLGVVYWIENKTLLRAMLEKIARSKYMEKKDAKDCALLYLALDRKSVLQSLMKLSQKDSDKKMVEFLSRNFNDEKNRAAALKNAFVLLSQHRLELAASFFILGGDVMSAAKICFKNMQDPQLALLLCHIASPSLVHDFIRQVLLPSAIEKNDKWQTSMFLWILGEKMNSLLEIVGLSHDFKFSGHSKRSIDSELFDLDFICHDSDVSDYCELLASHPSISMSENSTLASLIASHVASWTSYSFQRSGLTIFALEKLPKIISNADSKSPVANSSDFKFFSSNELNLFKIKSRVRDNEISESNHPNNGKEKYSPSNYGKNTNTNESCIQCSVLSPCVLNWMNYFLKRKLLLKIFSSLFPCLLASYYQFNELKTREDTMKENDDVGRISEKSYQNISYPFLVSILKDSDFSQKRWRVTCLDLLSSVSLLSAYQNHHSLLCWLVYLMNNLHKKKAGDTITSIHSSFSHDPNLVQFAKVRLANIALEAPSYLAKHFIFYSNLRKSTTKYSWCRSVSLELVKFSREISLLLYLVDENKRHDEMDLPNQENELEKRPLNHSPRTFNAICFLCNFLALWYSDDNILLHSLLKPILEDQDLVEIIKGMETKILVSLQELRGGTTIFSKETVTPDLLYSRISSEGLISSRDGAKKSEEKSPSVLISNQLESGISIESTISEEDSRQVLRYSIWNELAFWLKKQLSKSDPSSGITSYSSFGWVSPQLFSKAQSHSNVLSESIAHLISPPLSPPKSRKFPPTSPLMSNQSSLSPSPTLSPPPSHPHSPSRSTSSLSAAIGGGLNVVSSSSFHKLHTEKKQRNSSITNFHGLISCVSYNIEKQFAFHEKSNLSRCVPSLCFPAFSHWLWDIGSTKLLESNSENQQVHQQDNKVSNKLTFLNAYDFKSNTSDKSAISASLSGPSTYSKETSSQTPNHTPSIPHFNFTDETILELWKTFVKKEKILFVMNVENVTCNKETIFYKIKELCISGKRSSQSLDEDYCVSNISSKNKEDSKREIRFGEPEVAIKMPDDLLEAICLNKLDSRQLVVATNRKGLLTLDLETMDYLSSSTDNLWSLANYPRNCFPNSKSFYSSSFSSSSRKSPAQSPSRSSTSVPSISPPLPPSLSISPSFSSPPLTSLGGNDARSVSPFISKAISPRTRESSPTVPGYGGIGAWGLGWEDWDDYVAGYSDPPATLSNTVSRSMCSHPSRPFFLVGSNNTHVYLWEFGKSSASATYGVLPSNTYAVPYTIPSVAAVKFDPLGQRFATSATDGTLSTWQLEVVGRTAVPPLQTKQCFSRSANAVVHLGSSGSVLVGAGSNSSSDEINSVNVHNSLVIWDTLSDSSMYINSHKGGARALCTMDGSYEKSSSHIDNHLIVSGGRNGEVALHDIRYLSNSNKFVHNTKKNSKIFSENGLGAFRESNLRNDAGLAVWFIPKAHSSSITSLVCIPGTSMFISGSKDGDVKVWDVSTFQLVRQWNQVHEKKTFFNAHGFGAIVQAGVTDMVLLPSGLLTSGGDGYLKLFPFQIN